MGKEVLVKKPFDSDFCSSDLYIWHWFQFVYHSQLLLAERKQKRKAETHKKIFNNPRYRTALCVKYTTFGYCPYGDQCHFIHDPVQIDLEKCLDWLSGSSLSSPQLSSEQTDDYLGSASFSGTKSETVQLKKRRKKGQLELATESECSKKKSESSWELESVSSIEIVNNVIDAMAVHDPFQSDTVYNEVELKPLQFNVFDDFLDVINPQSVLPKKQ